MRFDMATKDNWAAVKEAIEACDNENELRELRQCADSRLQTVKQEHAVSKREDFVTKYKGKYILMYGKHYTRISSFDNFHKTTIVLVEDVKSVSYDFMYVSGKRLEIDYSCNPYDARLTDINEDNTGNVKITNSEEEDYRIDFNEISAIIDSAKVEEIKKKTLENVGKLLEGWGA
jgi:hypothetical protein